MQLPSSLKGEYERLSSDRSPYLMRGRDASKYTIPTLLPPEGRNSGSKLRSGYSNYGARCVNSLSSRLLLALLPARQAFFRFAIEDRLLEQLGGKDLRADVEKALANYESSVQSEIESTPTRTPAGEAVKHLLVVGNVLTYMLPAGGLKVYPLHAYVCLRDDSGNVLRIVTEDRVSPLTLPESIRGAVKARLIERTGNRGTPEKTVCVYTGVFRNGNHWKVWQEVEGIKVPESEGTYPLDASPWMPLRWTPVDGESYGRGMVEDYLGYFISLESLTAALVKGTAVAAKVVYLRNPNGTTKAAALTRSETGDVIDGKPDDVHALQSEKAHDFRTCREMINDLKEELAYAFALNQAIQRNAERVTAEEIRYMAQELDSLLGGIYSTLSLEFQLPFLRRLMLQMEKAGKLPALPKKSLRPVIVTGLDALGRGAELDNLRAYVKDIVDLGGPEALDSYLYFDDLMKRLATARGIKTEGLNKPRDVVEQEQEQKRVQGMVAHLGPNAINQMGQLAKQGMAQEGTTQ
jgi:hypothetical protein